MEITYPTRNEARSILTSIVNNNRKEDQFGSESLEEIASYVILWYQNKHNFNFATFVFTNALVDMFPQMGVDNENSVDGKTNFRNELSSEKIDDFFINLLGCTLDDFLTKIKKEEMEYKVTITSLGEPDYNPTWINDSDSFILQLLDSYQRFKEKKGMLFQKEDIMQVPIDYSIAICYYYFKQNKYLNRNICSNFVKTFTDTTNAILSTGILSYPDIEFDVLKDLSNPKCIKASFDFIKQL